MSRNRSKLQYDISSWAQATRCLSNNSKKLRISVSRFIDLPDLDCQLVSVLHLKYGTLFAAITSGQGDIITDQDESGAVLPFMTTSEILVQLAKFGFNITYNQEPHLSDSQLEFLTKILNLGFDAITQVNVRTQTAIVPTIIAYNSSITMDYLAFNSTVAKNKFDTDLERSAIINIAIMEPLFTWDWLTYTCQIEDILHDNDSSEEVTVVDNSELEDDSTEDDTMYDVSQFTLYDTGSILLDESDANTD